MPEGALYWYGNNTNNFEFVRGETADSNVYGEFRNNSLYLYRPNSGTSYSYGWFIGNDVDLSKYSTLKYEVKSAKVSNNYSTCGVVVSGIENIRRYCIQFEGGGVYYHLSQKKTYSTSASGETVWDTISNTIISIDISSVTDISKPSAYIGTTPDGHFETARLWLS